MHCARCIADHPGLVDVCDSVKTDCYHVQSLLSVCLCGLGSNF